MARKIKASTDNSGWVEPKKKIRKRRKPMTEEQKQAAAARLEKAREARAAKNPDYGQSGIHVSLRDLPEDHPAHPNKVKKYPPCNPFLSRLMRSGYLARSCSDRSILMAPLIPRTPPTNIPLTLTLEAEELSPVKELLLLDRPIASIGLLLSGKSIKDCVLLAAIFQSYISIKQIKRRPVASGGAGGL